MDPDNEYLLIGEVVGYAVLPAPICQENWFIQPNVPKCDEAWGVELAVDRVLAAPENLPRTLDVYQFDLGADCGRVPWSEEEVRRFPLGARFKVSARKFSGPITPGTDQAFRIEAEGQYAVFKQIAPNSSTDSVVASAFDYARVDLNGADDLDIRFELKKDLVRLRNARTYAERYSILERLADFDWESMSSGEHPILQLIDENIADPVSASALRERHQRTRYYVGAIAAGKEEQFLRERAYAGEAEFQYHLARLIAERSPQEAIEWLTKSAGSGFVMAELALGRLHESLADAAAASEAARHRSAAAAAYHRAARAGHRLTQQGDAWAMLMMAQLYEEGLGGLPVDFAAAECLKARGMIRPPRAYRSMYGDEAWEDNAARSCPSAAK